MTESSPQVPSPEIKFPGCIFMIVNAIGLVLIPWVYSDGHKIIGLNLLEVIALWIFAQIVVIWFIIR